MSKIKEWFFHPVLEFEENSEIVPHYIGEKNGHKEYKYGILVDGKFKVCKFCGGTGLAFKSKYDCDECEGKRVLFLPELPKWVLNSITSWYESESDSIRIQNAERRAGA